MDYSAQGYAEYGVNKGDWAYYIDIDGVGTNGFRYFGQSDAERAYADIGYRAWNSELHLSMTGGAAGRPAIAGTTPAAARPAKSMGRFHDAADDGAKSMGRFHDAADDGQRRGKDHTVG